MTSAQLIPLVIQASILLLVLGLGLHATPEDATYLFRRPGLMVRALLAMGVVVPFVAAVLAAAFDLYPPVEIALVLLAVSPVPPILPGKQLKSGGHTNYVYGLLVAAALCAIVLVPLMIEILGWIFQREAHISPAVIAKVVLISVLIPLVIGLTVRRFAPAFAERMAPLVTRLGTVLLIVGLLPILVSAWPGITSLIGNGTILAIVAVVGAGLVAGHVLGGPDPDNRRALAIASSMRHPGVTLAIANVNFPGEKLVFAAVLLFAVVNAVVTIPYVFWAQRRHSEVAGGVIAER
jgi:BASS family bile acid:Na+ symporter